jgi:hypothetical protein
MTLQIASSLIKYFELLAGLTGIVCYYKNRKSVWFLFSIFLLCLFGFETLGHLYVTHKMYGYNTILYKWIVVPLLFFMYHFCFAKMINKKSRPIIVVSYCIFIVLALLENLFLADKHYYSISFTLSYGCIAILFFSLAYFYELLKSDDILIFKKLMPFWFCLGLMIFYLGDFPDLFFGNYLAIIRGSSLAVAYRWIFIFSNYIMYLLFTIGFICSKPKQSLL